MNPWLRWLGLISGFVVGAIIGAIIAVFVAGILLFVVYPMFAGEINWDQPGLGFVPVLFAPAGLIAGGMTGILIARRALNGWKSP